MREVSESDLLANDGRCFLIVFNLCIGCIRDSNYPESVLDLLEASSMRSLSRSRDQTSKVAARTGTTRMSATVSTARRLELSRSPMSMISRTSIEAAGSACGVQFHEERPQCTQVHPETPPATL